MTFLTNKVNERPIGWSYPVLLVSVILLGAWTQSWSPSVFSPYLGNLSPVVLLLIIGVVGYGCLWYLRYTYKLRVFEGLSWPGLCLPVGVAFGFGLIAIGIDLRLHLPVDLNVIFPVSLVFYPVIGFFAEMIFHVIPATLTTALLRGLGRGFSTRKNMRLSFLIAALTEPVYHVCAMRMAGEYGHLYIIIIGAHILLISLFQISLFRRKGFYHMYLFRMVYYMIWHMAWGCIRLQLI